MIPQLLCVPAGEVGQHDTQVEGPQVPGAAGTTLHDR